MARRMKAQLLLVRTPRRHVLGCVDELQRAVDGAIHSDATGVLRHEDEALEAIPGGPAQADGTRGRHAAGPRCPEICEICEIL